MELAELGLKVVEQVRVGGLAQEGPVVVGSEGFLNLLSLVGEVQNHRVVLARVNTIEPGQGLDGVDPAQFLVHVHGVQQGLVKPRLEFIRHDQEAVFFAIEGPGRLDFREAVHVGLGVVDPGVPDGA